ncbi:MAG: hypothetical protein JXB29_07995 [Sedimentisphaerales bacterium]|nr:hypothetical protein [Sedimentisphaerales bacterium]
MNPHILAVKSITVYSPVGIILFILMLIVYVGIPVFVIGFLIRTVRYFKTAGNEQKLIRMELGKLADEVQQLRQERKDVKDVESSAN